MVPSYEAVEAFPGWDKAPAFFQSIILENHVKKILEIGSGANPTLPAEFILGNQLSYVTSDLYLEELEKANPVFERLVIDFSGASVDKALHGSFDCIFSRMVGEHIENGEQYHKNIYQMLRPGGISVHCFATLWTLPFVLNRFLPEFFTDGLLRAVAPRDRHRHGKFKAYYSWSRGPTKKMLRSVAMLGFEVVTYTGYFGHGYYRIKLPWLQPMEALKSRVLLRHPVPQLCSYAMLILRKPVEAGA